MKNFILILFGLYIYSCSPKIDKSLVVNSQIIGEWTVINHCDRRAGFIPTRIQFLKNGKGYIKPPSNKQYDFHYYMDNDTIFFLYDSHKAAKYFFQFKQFNYSINENEEHRHLIFRFPTDTCIIEMLADKLK